MRACKTCGSTKPLKEYSSHETTRDGVSPYCKQCIRDRNRQWRIDNPERARAKQLKNYLKSTYGMTVEEYDKLTQAQNNLCAICSLPETTKNGRLAVDHCHRTGQVRGLLCMRCNTSIGRLNDDPALLRRAAEYLEESSKS